jgi:small nuclear ribonucleoprotein (snRNP)-like protein
VVEMIKENIHFLKAKIDNDPVRIHFLDGEIVTAKIISVSESENDVIFHILSTNREPPRKAGAIRATFDEIDHVA